MLLLLGGCLINKDLYEERRAELLDADGDGFTTAAEGGDDCDDTDDAVHPGATDTPYDGVDQDCSGADLTDVDGDGFDHGDDCDDTDAAVHPGATETPYDAVDQDCSGADLTDVDGDGFDRGEDCDDTDGAVHPGATDTPYDGVDQDCSGADLADVDGDGFDRGADCDDADAAVHPGAAETWADGFTDNDCDENPDPASIVFGTSTRYASTAGAWAGSNLAGLGDLDGDGAAEWAAAAVFDPSRYERGGAVYVATGSGGGSLATARVIHGGGAGWYTGTGLQAGADLDGDGLGDLLIGATGADDGAGAAFVVSSAALAGATELHLPDDARTVMRGVTAQGFAAAQVTVLGDTDGDGLDEIAVAAPYLELGGLPQAGRVYVLPADVTGELSLADADWTWDGYFDGGALGNVVASAGDQDGDGRDDVLLSMLTGVAAWIVPGEGGVVSDVALAAIYNPDGLPITNVAAVGDIDGDGTRDVVIHHDHVSLYVDLTGTPSRGMGDGAYSRLLFPDGSLVYDVSDLGDRDGDGLAETVLGVPFFAAEGTGWVGIVPGSAWERRSELQASDLELTAASVRPGAWAGYRARVLGDVDGDGQDDLGIGAPQDDEGGPDAGGVVVLPVPE